MLVPDFAKVFPMQPSMAAGTQQRFTSSDSFWLLEATVVLVPMVRHCVSHLLHSVLLVPSQCGTLREEKIAAECLRVLPEGS